MTKLEQIRKAIVGAGLVAVAYAGIALDVLGQSNLSTRDGVIAAIFDLAVGLGIWRVPNAR